MLRCAPVGDDGSSLWLIVLADAPYLVALALIKQGGVRAMPLGGRSLPVDAGEPVDEAPHAMAQEVVLELLVRSGSAVTMVTCAGRRVWAVCSWWSCQWSA